MSFKENVLKKIKIDTLASQVVASLGPPAGEKKVDKQAMRKLLEMSPCTYSRKRDLDLYICEEGDGKDKILVLDNELALYQTTPQDVAMRKSPTVKEMISIRNAIKILKDSDVVVSRRALTVEAIQKVCIEKLDLRYAKSDIDGIMQDGRASLENGYTDGVLESLGLFAELLGYLPPPRAIKMPHCYMAGTSVQKASGETLYGPLVMYNMMHNTLKFMDDIVGGHDKAQIEHLNQVAKGTQPAAQEGADVFGELRAQFLKDDGRHNHGPYRAR